MAEDLGWEQAKDKGSAAFKKQDYEDALEWFSKSLELDTGNNSGQQHILYSNRAAAYLALGRAPEALMDANSAIKTQATFGKAYGRKGAALYRLGRYSESAEAYEEGVKHDPSNNDMRQAAAEARKAAAAMKMPTIAELKEKITAFASRNRVAGILALPRLFILYNALLYFLPVFSRPFSVRAYRRAAFMAILTHIYLLYQQHGRPSFNMQYLQRIMLDTTTQYLFMCILLVTSKRPYFLGLAVIVLSEGLHLLWVLATVTDIIKPAATRGLSARLVTLGCAFTQDPRYGTLSAEKKWSALFRRVPEYSVKLEIAMGILMMLELLTPSRNLVSVILYWQFLQMRYLLDRDGVVKETFKQLDNKLLAVTSNTRCPALIGKGYGLIRGYMARAVQLPDPNDPNGQQARPRCTVM